MGERKADDFKQSSLLDLRYRSLTHTPMNFVTYASGGMKKLVQKYRGIRGETNNEFLSGVARGKGCEILKFV